MGIRVLRKVFSSLGVVIVMMLVVFLIELMALAKTMYVVEIDGVNLRSGPSVEHRSIAVLKSNQPLEILGEEGGWYHVRTSKDEEGWVSKSLLKGEKPTGEKPVAEQLSIQDRHDDEQSQMMAKLMEENKLLKKYSQLYESSEEDLKRLRNENLRLQNHQDQIWAAVGAGILLLGWLMGLITGNFYRKGKSKYHYSLD